MYFMFVCIGIPAFVPVRKVTPRHLANPRCGAQLPCELVILRATENCVLELCNTNIQDNGTGSIYYEFVFLPQIIVLITRQLWIRQRRLQSKGLNNQTSDIDASVLVCALLFTASRVFRHVFWRRGWSSCDYLPRNLPSSH